MDDCSCVHGKPLCIANLPYGEKNIVGTARGALCTPLNDFFAQNPIGMMQVCFE